LRRWHRWMTMMHRRQQSRPPWPKRRQARANVVRHEVSLGPSARRVHNLCERPGAAAAVARRPQQPQAAVAAALIARTHTAGREVMPLRLCPPVGTCVSTKRTAASTITTHLAGKPIAPRSNGRTRGAAAAVAARRPRLGRMARRRGGDGSSLGDCARRDTELACGLGGLAAVLW
jgi:hypothetical protein